MNKREAKAYALRALAAETRHHVSNGSEWLQRPLRADNVAVDEDGEFAEADHARVVAAVHEVADELERRAQRLAEPRRRRR